VKNALIRPESNQLSVDDSQWEINLEEAVHELTITQYAMKKSFAKTEALETKSTLDKWPPIIVVKKGEL
jgi:hypothetical protein